MQNVRSNFVMGAGELQVIPYRERIAEVGLSEAEIGLMVEAALGGRIALATTVYYRLILLIH